MGRLEAPDASERGGGCKFYFERSLYRLVFCRTAVGRRVVEMAWHNLLPEYRRAMVDKIIESLDDIERLGRKWERQKDLDRRYVPPPPMAEFHLTGAGYSGTVSRGKVAALTAEERCEVAAVTQPLPKAETKQRERASRKGKEGKESASTAPQRSAETARPVAAAAVSGRTYAQAAVSPPAERRTQAGRAYAGAQPPRATAPRPNAPAGGSYVREPPGRSASAVIGPNGEFIGACFKCQAVGHRASECPQIICYYCQQKGHISRECQTRRAPCFN